MVGGRVGEERASRVLALADGRMGGRLERLSRPVAAAEREAEGGVTVRWRHRLSSIVYEAIV